MTACVGRCASLLSVGIVKSKQFLVRINCFKTKIVTIQFLVNTVSGEKLSALISLSNF